MEGEEKRKSCLWKQRLWAMWRPQLGWGPECSSGINFRADFLQERVAAQIWTWIRGQLDESWARALLECDGRTALGIRGCG